MIYKIYCGRQIPTTNKEVSEKDFHNLLTDQSLFDSFTIWKCEGYWLGELEKTFVIEILTDELDKVLELAKLYQNKFEQQAVLVIDSNSQSHWIN